MRVALVTGGGTGLGRAISLALAADGFDIGINYSSSKAEAEETADAVTKFGRRAVAVQADVAEDGAVRRMVASVEAELGGLDVLVNNAGTTKYAALTDLDALTDEVWDHVFGVNLRGAFYCARAAAPMLSRDGHGKIVNTASNSAFRPTGSSIPYMTSKAALVMLTKCLARALAPGIQVNAVAPGGMATRWADRFFPTEVRDNWFATRPITPVDDVARAVVFLANNDSVTGETIIIDRGDNL